MDRVKKTVNLVVETELLYFVPLRWGGPSSLILSLYFNEALFQGFGCFWVLEEKDENE